jgi:NAD(P)H-nitrite reductase large subunit
VNSELEYLQERRTAAMLQKIPEIVNDEFQQGDIRSRKAIFTVGLYHIHEIIRFLNENKIIIHAPESASTGMKDYATELNLQKENFGVSIILPKTLTGDQKILEINKLNEIVKQYRIQTSKVSSSPRHGLGSR